MKEKALLHFLNSPYKNESREVKSGNQAGYCKALCNDLGKLRLSTFTREKQIQNLRGQISK
ncbi:hypothetical protein ABEB36_011335 [Hypothenemus hampei]|uniref:Uncharacterized protein n=1 Tax=Hypothenemus hampei TaxID=57062 RepID=A0ABD1EF26_HYPHA